GGTPSSMPPPKTYTPAAFASSITAWESRTTSSHSPSGTTIAALGKEIRYLAMAPASRSALGATCARTVALILPCVWKRRQPGLPTYRPQLVRGRELAGGVHGSEVQFHLVPAAPEHR